MANEDVVGLVAALMQLRGESLGYVAKQTQIQKANLSLWLKGTQHVVSEKRVLVLLDHLGIVGGQLREDVIHHWVIQKDLNTLKWIWDRLLNTEQKEQLKIYACPECRFQSIRYIRCPQNGQILNFELTLESGLNQRLDINPAMLGYGTQITIDPQLGLWQTDMPMEALAPLFEYMDAEYASREITPQSASVQIKWPRDEVMRPQQQMDADALARTLEGLLDSGISPLQIRQILEADILSCKLQPKN